MNNSQKLFAVFSFRYDSQLVADLLCNLSFVDGFICHDDRNNNKLWYDEGPVRRSLVEKARNAGADWVLGMDPDERIEQGAGKLIRNLINTNDNIIYGFHFRELWTKDEYRIDGIWNEKVKPVLFPLKDGQIFDDLRVHSCWSPINHEYKRSVVDINIYHLKNIDPKNRKKRARLYEKLDPEHKIHNMGYQHLCDESNIKLKKIDAGREYYPKYSEDYKIVQYL